LRDKKSGVSLKAHAALKINCLLRFESETGTELSHKMQKSGTKK
jgi:hypothetical protein